MSSGVFISAMWYKFSNILKGLPAYSSFQMPAKLVSWYSTTRGSKLHTHGWQILKSRVEHFWNFISLHIGISIELEVVLMVINNREQQNMV